MRPRYPAISARARGVLILGTLCTAPTAAQSRRSDASAPRDTSPFETLERVVRAHLAEHDVPGAAAAIVRGDSIVYAKGVRCRQHRNGYARHSGHALPGRLDIQDVHRRARDLTRARWRARAGDTGGATREWAPSSTLASDGAPTAVAERRAQG